MSKGCVPGIFRNGGVDGAGMPGQFGLSSVSVGNMDPGVLQPIQNTETNAAGLHACAAPQSVRTSTSGEHKRNSDHDLIVSGS